MEHKKEAIGTYIVRISRLRYVVNYRIIPNYIYTLLFDVKDYLFYIFYSILHLFSKSFRKEEKKIYCTSYKHKIKKKLKRIGFN